jgi:3-deoxy-7-phosphoheptulonate synthase
MGKTSNRLETSSEANWLPDSWQTKTIRQMPNYPDAQAVESSVRALSKLPPLVTSWEVEKLRSDLADIAEGDGFLLQGGDCAEHFSECDSAVITGKLKILLQMSLILVHGSRKKVTRVGRIAGQYTKPRSSDTETRDDLTLPSYRGDLVNSAAFVEDSRRPDPDLLIRGYHHSAMTLNFIRSLIDGGFADLHHPEYWQLDFVKHADKAAQYQKMVSEIGESIRFLENISGEKIDQLNRVEFFTSHEALHLYYEQAQTRQVPRRRGWYNLATHFPWIGNRTNQIDGAHVEYCRGIENPVGVKVGPDMEPDRLLELIGTLNSSNEPGRLTLIHRFGMDQVEEHLPKLIEAVEGAKKSVVWCCDPMHGNTEVTDNGYKTRDFKRILGELEIAFDVHKSRGSYLGGVHFELTGDDVTECTGGARGLTSDDLARDYRTQVDPRLNYEQALEMSILIAEKMRNGSS